MSPGEVSKSANRRSSSSRWVGSAAAARGVMPPRAGTGSSHQSSSNCSMYSATSSWRSAALRSVTRPGAAGYRSRLSASIFSRRCDNSVASGNRRRSSASTRSRRTSLFAVTVSRVRSSAIRARKICSRAVIENSSIHTDLPSFSRSYAASSAADASLPTSRTTSPLMSGSFSRLRSSGGRNNPAHQSASA